MFKRNQRDLLTDIKEAIQRIILYTEDIDIDEFFEDIKTQ